MKLFVNTAHCLVKNEKKIFFSIKYTNFKNNYVSLQGSGMEKKHFVK